MSVTVPDVIAGVNEKQLKKLITAAEIDANTAYAFALKRKPVGHIAFAFEATKTHK